MNFETKVALVTGATRGIGRAIKLELGRQNAIVIGTSQSINGAKIITDTLKEHGYKGIGLVLDVCNDNSIQDVLEYIKKNFNYPAILVNNAGIYKDNILLRMKIDDWIDVLNTNLNSIYRLSKAVIKNMLKNRWGRIINIGSIVGSIGNIGQTNYAAAKAGVEGFTKSLAREVGYSSITVNTVAPGFIETDMTNKLSDIQRTKILETIPLRRLGQAQEVANVVAFLASNYASYITGATVPVNGGMYMN